MNATKRNPNQLPQKNRSLFFPILTILGICFIYHIVSGIKRDCMGIYATNSGALHGSRSEPSNTSSNTITFRGFNKDLIPSKSVLDMNIGTNKSPFQAMDGRHRILIDPLFDVCDRNAKKVDGVTAFCFAVSDFTGFETFYEYNEHSGVSSSLSQVSKGTSHEKFKPISRRTVLVLEAMVLFSAIKERQSSIYRLKLDMQGHDLTTLRNIKDLLREKNFVAHIKAECFCPNEKGLQIYQVDNSCKQMSELLEEVGYATEWNCDTKEYSDIHAYKKGSASGFLSEEAFKNSK